MNQAQHLAFDKDLKIDQIVHLRWTNCYRYYQARAKIVRLNLKTVVCELQHDVPTGTGSHYHKGREIKVSRYTHNNWSLNNCILWALIWNIRNHTLQYNGEPADREVTGYSAQEIIEKESLDPRDNTIKILRLPEYESPVLTIV